MEGVVEEGVWRRENNGGPSLPVAAAQGGALLAEGELRRRAARSERRARIAEMVWERREEGLRIAAAAGRGGCGVRGRKEEVARLPVGWRGAEERG